MFAIQKRLIRPALLLAAGGALLLTAALFPSHSQSITLADTPLKVAQLLDCVIQPRFQKDAGAFGMDRIITLDGHHSISGMLRPENNQEKVLLKRVAEANRDYTISFLHCAHVPGKYRANTFPRNPRTAGEVKPSLISLIAQGKIYPTLEPNASREEREAVRQRFIERENGLLKIATDALPNLKQGKGVEAKMNRWFVAVRPIQASKESCLGCHTGAKQGEMLGAVVYAVSNETRKVSKPGVRIGFLR